MPLYVHGTGPAVLVLQGGPGLPSKSVEPIGDLLRDGFRVVRFEDPSSTLRGRVDRIEGIRKELGEERWLVLGHSWGAAVGALYSVAHPARVQGLILAHPMEISTAFCDFAGEEAAGEANDPFAQEYNPDLAEALWEDLQLAWPDAAGDGYDLTELARQITVPSLVLLGDNDGIDRRSGELWAELIKARLTSLSGAGHWSFVEQPELFRQTVMEFLLAHAGRRAVAAA